MGVIGDHQRLHRLLGGDDTAWIVERARTRLARGRPLTGSVTLTEATETQRRAVGRLLGRAMPAGRSVSISLDRVDELLRSSGAWPDGLASAVVTLTGPIASSDRDAENAAWRAVGERMEDLAGARPELALWIDALRARGHLKRVTADVGEALRLIDDLRSVVDALPTSDESLAGFAARVLHKAHALDAGTPLGNVAVSAADILGRPAVSDAAAARTWTAARRRVAWESVGVLVDDLSSTVLVLNLPGADGPSATSIALAAMADAGQPTILTLRQVVSDSLGEIPPVVHACENPAVVSAAADHLGPSALPLVCVRGQPGAAATTLLRRLAEGGASVRYHGDFDWGGVSIANTLTAHVAWQPWRYRAIDYLDVLGKHERKDALAPLTGSAVDTPWDPGLRLALAEQGVRLEEELVLDHLLGDLEA